MGIYEGIKDALSIAQKADNVDLYKQLLEVGAQALEMQEEIRQLKEENAELKKGEDLESRIIRHEEPYITLRDESPEIHYCAVCWGNEKKLIQLSTHGCIICETKWRAACR